MAITAPQPGNDVDATLWGEPITNEVNRLTTFTAPTPWVALTLINGWTNAAGEQACQIRSIGDMVYIRGRAGGGAHSTTIFNCPTQYRPPRGMAMAGAYYSTSPAGWFWCLNDFRSDGNYVQATVPTVQFAVIDGYWSRTA